MGLREEARAGYRAVAGALAELARRPESTRTIRYRLRIVERDPVRRGVTPWAGPRLRGRRRHGEARRAFRTYAARMEQIGVEPAPLPASAGVPAPLFGAASETL